MKFSNLRSVTMYCHRCFEEHRPKSGITYAVKFGTDVYFLVCFTHEHQRGFTPHFVEFAGMNKENVLYKKACAVEGCGIVSFVDTKGEVDFKFINQTKEEISVNNWNAMLQFGIRDPDYDLE